MMNYILRRTLLIIPTLIAISVIAFIVIKLPPGDYLTSYIQTMRMSGQEVNEAMIKSLERRYGLDKPAYVQYLRWVSGFFRGDMGMSFQWNKPVTLLLKERIGFTILISLGTILFQYMVAIPIGVYSAIRQYSAMDYIISTIGFIGMSVPSFLLALILMFIGVRYFGASVGGLFSSQYMGEPWSIPKVLDMLSRIWLPIVIVGISGTAGLIRVMRSQMLDELGKDYVKTAHSKGLPEILVVLRHPFRLAINPLISTAGWLLPQIVSGDTLVGIVLTLPTVGPLLLQALLFQDMYLAGSILMVQSALVVIGTLLSDILLAVSDPRIRYD